MQLKTLAASLTAAVLLGGASVVVADPPNFDFNGYAQFPVGKSGIVPAGAGMTMASVLTNNGVVPTPIPLNFALNQYTLIVQGSLANVIGNALRELNLEDVEPAAAPAEKPTIVEFRTFDGLVVRVTGEKSGDASWITLEASVDAAQAAAAPPPAAPADGVAAATPPATDPNAEAARINAKVGGWRYKIAGYQYDQMTRRMSELLKAPPAAAPAPSPRP